MLIINSTRFFASLRMTFSSSHKWRRRACFERSEKSQTSPPHIRLRVLCRHSERSEAKWGISNKWY